METLLKSEKKLIYSHHFLSKHFLCVPLAVLKLSLIQGATEFLPVSSSAHLVLYNKFVIGVKNNLSLDIAMHIGSLLAVILLVSKPLKEHVNNVLTVSYTHLRAHETQ